MASSNALTPYEPGPNRQGKLLKAYNDRFPASFDEIRMGHRYYLQVQIPKSAFEAHEHSKYFRGIFNLLSKELRVRPGTIVVAIGGMGTPGQREMLQTLIMSHGKLLKALILHQNEHKIFSNTMLEFDSNPHTLLPHLERIKIMESIESFRLPSAKHLPKFKRLELSMAAYTDTIPDSYVTQVKFGEPLALVKNLKLAIPTLREGGSIREASDRLGRVLNVFYHLENARITVEDIIDPTTLTHPNLKHLFLQYSKQADPHFSIGDQFPNIKTFALVGKQRGRDDHYVLGYTVGANSGGDWEFASPSKAKRTLTTYATRPLLENLEVTTLVQALLKENSSMMEDSERRAIWNRCNWRDEGWDSLYDIKIFNKKTPEDAGDFALGLVYIHQV